MKRAVLAILVSLAIATTAWAGQTKFGASEESGSTCGKTHPFRRHDRSRPTGIYAELRTLPRRTCRILGEHLGHSGETYASSRQPQRGRL